MRGVRHTWLWLLSISLLLAAVILWILFRFVLPVEGRSSRPAAYTIREWEGQVAVFERDQPFPRQVFDVYVETLPPEIQQQVRQGVPAEDEARLSVLLEDYTG